MHIEHTERIQVTVRERDKQRRLPELKSQKIVNNFIYIQDPERMQHIDLKNKRANQILERKWYQLLIV